MHIRTLLLVILFVFRIELSAQDTIPIYFDFGKSIVSQDERLKLEHIPINYSLSEVDSIYFIGSTDSIGDVSRNIKLAKKRAKKVRNICQHFLESIPTTIKAKGEISQGETKLNRAVKMILFYKVEPFSIVDTPIIVDDIRTFLPDKNVPSFCYNVDNDLLRSCMKRKVTYKKKNYMLLELEMHNNFKFTKKDKRFYASYSKKDSSFLVKKIRWKNKVTGKFWWSKNRMISYIPLDSWEQFKVFEKLNNCTSCSSVFPSQPDDKLELKLETDQFLMANFQSRFNWFSSKIKIRVPKEFVDLDAKYYQGCSKEDPIVWKTKSWGKRKNYYYAKLKVRLPSCLSNITKESLSCKADTNTTCNDCFIRCGFSHEDVCKENIQLKVLLGSYLGNGMTGYAGMLFDYDGYNYFSKFSASFDDSQNLYLMGQIDRYLVRFPMEVLNPFQPYRKPGLLPKHFGSLYFGIEAGYRATKDESLKQTNINLHTGFSYRMNRLDLFIHGGYEANINQLKINPMMRIGITFKLVNITAPKLYN